MSFLGYRDLRSVTGVTPRRLERRIAPEFEVGAAA